MIPINSYDTQNGINIVKYKSLSYRLNDKKEEIKGFVDKEEAIRQAVYKILRTERYSYEIYDWSYGIELKDLFGKEKSIVKAELIGRISDALTADDRINQVYDFIFTDIDKTTIYVKFTIETDFGSDEIGIEVKI